ncbi:MAG: hypothetical protein MHM6MM_002856 [Cercozoa sp. M6MM]
MSHCFHEGWLTKLGQHRKTWKRRHFRLYRDGRLTYGKSDDASDDVIGDISLLTCLSFGISLTVEGTLSARSRPFCIDIVTPDRTWVIDCGTEENRAEWLQKLQHIASKYIQIEDNKLTPLLTGYLVKRGRVVKNWRRRFCVVFSGMIAYFPSQAAALRFMRIAGHSKETFLAVLKKESRGLIRLSKDSLVKECLLPDDNGPPSHPGSPLSMSENEMESGDDVDQSSSLNGSFNSSNGDSMVLDRRRSVIFQSAPMLAPMDEKLSDSAQALLDEFPQASAERGEGSAGVYSCCFCIESPTRNFYLRAPSPSARAQWVKVCRSVVSGETSSLTTSTLVAQTQALSEVQTRESSDSVYWSVRETRKMDNRVPQRLNRTASRCSSPKRADSSCVSLPDRPRALTTIEASAILAAPELPDY